MQTYRQLRQERVALVAWMAKDGYSHALTLNTDRELSRQQLRKIVSGVSSPPCAVDLKRRVYAPG